MRENMKDKKISTWKGMSIEERKKTSNILAVNIMLVFLLVVGATSLVVVPKNVLGIVSMQAAIVASTMFMLWVVCFTLKRAYTLRELVVESWKFSVVMLIINILCILIIHHLLTTPIPIQPN